MPAVKKWGSASRLVSPAGAAAARRLACSAAVWLLASLTLFLLISSLGCARPPKGMGKPGEMKPPSVKAPRKKPAQILASTNSVNSIRLDSDTVWFCTDGGVVRFQKPTDSYLRFTKDDGLLSNLTWAAAERGDDLWVGGVGGVSRLNTKTGEAQTWRTLNNAPIFLVSRLIVTSAGVACVLVEENPEWSGCARAGLYRFEPGDNTWSYRCPLEEAPSSDAPDLLPEEAEFLKQALQETKLIEAINNGDKPFSFCAAAATQANRTWAGSPEGLFYRNEPSTSWHRATYQGYADVSALAMDGQNIWVGTDDAGIFTFDPQKEQTHPFGLPTDLPSNHVLDLVARPDSLWVAYDGGICRVSLPSLQMEPLAEETEYPVSDVRCLAQAGDTIYFVAPSRGVYSIDSKAGKFAAILDFRTLGVSKVKDMAVMGNSLWLSSERGLIAFDLSTLKHRLFPSDQFSDVQDWEKLPVLPAADVTFVAHGDQLSVLAPATGKYSLELSVDSGRGISGLCLVGNTLYIGTEGGGLYSHQLGTRSATLVKGIGEFISDLAADDSALWIANSEYEGYTVGLQWLDLKNGSLRTFGLQDGLPSEDVLALASLDGQLWLATSGGICRLPQP